MYARKSRRINATRIGSATIPSALLLSLPYLLLAQHSGAPGRVTLDKTRSIGAPTAYRNLTLFPVYSSSARAADNLVTLDEGLKAKTIKVKESTQGGDVNTLYVTNTGKKAAYLMAGEVVLGGQQDRCLGRDVIVPPGKHDLAVTVFCVEHGRWSGRHEFGETALTVAGADIRASAQEGAFAAGRPAVVADASPSINRPANARQTMSRRANRQGVQHLENLSSVGEKQQKVWDSVAAKNVKFKAAPATGTYRDVLNQSGGEAHKSIAPYVKALSTAFSTDPHLVGVVAAVNGQVVSADIFGDPALFRKLWPKLLRSYAADAAENAPARGHKISVVTPAEAKSFLVSAADAKSRMENKSDVSSTLRLESKDSLTYRLEATKAAGGMGGGLGAGTVHANILKK